MRSRPSLALILALSLAAPLLAGAEGKRFYGVAAGTTFANDPAEQMGVALSTSVAMPVGDDGAQSLVWARGKLLALFTGDSWAVVPSLMGSISGRLGPIELSLEGGFHIFGLTHYAEQTNFSIFGVGGGGGLMFWPSESWRFGVRGEVSWLPSSFSSPVDDPAVDASHSFLYISVLFSVELLADFD
ncbi:MAG: hypothetical protein JRH20_21000 [Deltaproteobacteria bacterium]|nr:hypothetical protein [Deltaproteobacteria bacterium]